MRRITIIAAALATAALARYSQYSATGYAPWYVAKDSSSVAGFADSARKADSSRAAWKADSAHIAWFAHAATYADSSRSTHRSDSSAYADSSRAAKISDSARAAGMATNALALGGIAASQYGTLAKDTTISRKVVSDSLSANTRTWTTLAAAKSSIHDSLSVERSFDSLVARNVTHDSATAMRSYIGGASTTGNAATATKLAAARTIATSGDATGTATAFDGSVNITIPTTVTKLNGTSLAGLATGLLKNTTSTGVPSIAVAGTDYLSPSTGVSGITATSPIVASASVGNVALSYAASGVTAGAYGSATAVPVLTLDQYGRATAASSTSISIPHTQISDWGAATSSFLIGNQTITLSGVVTGSGTTSIATTFANTHLAGINQDLMTTSYPEFSRVTTTYDVAPTASPNTNYVLAPLVAQRATNGSSTSMAGVGFHNSGTVGAFLYLNNSGHFQVNLNNGEIYSLIDGDNYSSFNNFTSGLATTTLTASGTISEGGTALSAKYLGINASIPHTQVSDWGTYINQPLLTTSSPTFAGQTVLGVSKAEELDLWETGSPNDFVRVMVANGYVYFGDNNSFGAIPTSLYGIQCGNVWSSGNGHFKSLDISTTADFTDHVTLRKGFIDYVANANSITLDETQPGTVYGSFGIVTLAASSVSVGRTYHVTNTNSTSVQIYVPTGTTVYVNGNSYVGNNSAITLASSNYRLLVFSHPATSIWSITY